MSNMQIEKGDKFHFLLKFPMYQDIRDTFWWEIKAETILDANTLWENYVLVKIINPHKQIAKKVAKYVDDCFKTRSLMVSAYRYSALAQIY